MGCNSCNNKKEKIKNKEGFIDTSNVSNFLSKYWIFVVIGLVIIIGLIYFFILRPKPEVNEFI
jgi:hypothetical protein